jgi:hypothetical protein
MPTDLTRPTGDEVLLPCPFCCERLDTNRLGNNPRHPDNDCFLSGQVIHVSQLTVWNTRATRPAEPADDEVPTEATGLAEQFAWHTSNADKQVETGQYGRECMEFGVFVWENRHAIRNRLSRATPQPPIAAEPGEVERYRHKARGTEYDLIGTAELQDARGDGVEEGALLAIYRGGDGKLWARRHSEFGDGRFERLATLTPPERTAGEGEE